MFGLSKGTIEIQIPKNEFRKKEVIQGKVILHLKKALKGKQLTIRLIANLRTKQGYGTKRSTRVRKIYDFKIDLDNEKVYSANQELVYPFSVEVPLKFLGEEMLPEQFKNTLEKVTKATQGLTGFRQKTSWYLVAKLVVPGLFNDIKKRIKINVLSS